MDENKGWTIFGCVLSVCVAIIIVSAQFYYRDINSKIVQMVESGADPIDAAVALDNIMSSEVIAAKLARMAHP
jgi:hypothetical protein